MKKTKLQKKVLYQYREYKKQEVIDKILAIAKIREQILKKSSFTDLCVYLWRLEEVV